MRFWLFFFCIISPFPLLAAKSLVIASEATYPPFVFVDEHHQIQGFDIDITKALCRHMQVSCQFQHLPWDSLIPSLMLGKIDAINGAIAITPQRQQQVGFTDPFYRSTAAVVALKTAKPGLAGKVIGYQAGTTFGEYLQDTYQHQVTIRGYYSNQSAFLDLIIGRLDAIIGDMPVITAWLAEGHKDKYATIAKPDSARHFGLGNAIAVRKTDQDLIQAFNKALQIIYTNGEYQRIKTKYFGSS